MKKEDLIVYEIYVKSFKDSNNDGIGDLNGIKEKLPYLKKLGINYIWLTPIYQTLNIDNGYDIKNYYKINSDYGTMKDFKNLIKEAKKHNINIMLDMVLNHTSTSHKWFKKALKGNKKYQNYYFFEKNINDKPPTNWQSKFGGSAWKYLDDLNLWYLHLFSTEQADLNWENNEVRKEILKIINFWLKKGIKGLRFDVINLISKPIKKPWKNNLESINENKSYTDGENIHKYLKELNEKSFSKYQNIFTVGELSSTDFKHFADYSNYKNHELDMGFMFYHLKTDYINGEKWSKNKQKNLKEFKEIIIDWQSYQQKHHGWIANFLSNHDQPRHISRFGNDKNYHYQSATCFAICYFFLRGTPFIFYGEEIGQTNLYNTKIEEFNDLETLNAYKKLQKEGLKEKEILEIINQKSRDNGRSPFAWNNQKYFGFSKNKPWLNYKNIYNITLENDLKNKNSIFKFYQEIINLRKDNKIFRTGKIRFLDNINDNLFIYERYDRTKKFLIILNLSDKKQDFTLENKGKIILNNYKNLNDDYLNPYQAIIFED
ncbi:/ treA / Trehalose-6-phosphate hydrolase /:309920 Reverse [Candidatus Hepatoplasma crinochetorum]|uniref:/ treA / Trehalose-6-phosphate hydrolase /:309920 Reverse n=1 Tax=Candidatus Hepatoplasma crinochetorum TaxID=295596 RepID=A0A0G7ZMZ9_9MOLU|nr:/ treA / Trehalose-6-phosphate hydrolase /:309920 Reverse [Candidatus Hepatoplasma crinochetorum]